MQCVDYLVAQAFCIWDGGRLETLEEWLAASGPGTFPWGNSPALKMQNDATYQGCRYPTVTDALLIGENPNGCPANLIPPAGYTIEYAAYGYSYEWPAQQGNDYVVFISPPGRTKGRGPGGHADLAGNHFELTSSLINYNAADVFTTLHTWTNNGSWEGHAYSKASAGSTPLINKYGKLGLRCVKTAPSTDPRL